MMVRKQARQRIKVKNTTYFNRSYTGRHAILIILVLCDILK